MNIAVIPARGGSKRIPRKNIRNFHGRPMISYAIKTAQESQLFDQIIVSTDDDEIASISESYGARIPWRRSPVLADDFATTLDVMQDAATRLATSVPSDSMVCCIYPAIPLLKPQYLQAGAGKILGSDWDYVLSAVLDQNPIQRSFTLESSNRLQLNYPEHEFTRTQDLPVSYHDAGQFYWGSIKVWSEKTPIFSANTTIVEIPTDLTVDIDTQEEWLLAERLFSLSKEKLNNRK